MKTVSLKCQDCGASLDVDEKREFCFCTFCGSKIMIEKEEIVHRIVDEARLKELEYSHIVDEQNRKLAESKQKENFKIKLILLAVWLIIVIALFLLSNSTASNAGFSPYQLILIPVFLYGIVIIVKEIKKFFKSN